MQARVSKVLEAAALLGCYDINFSHLKVLICNENIYNNVRQASILLLLLLLKCWPLLLSLNNHHTEVTYWTRLHSKTTYLINAENRVQLWPIKVDVERSYRNTTVLSTLEIARLNVRRHIKKTSVQSSWPFQLTRASRIWKKYEINWSQ